MSHTLQNKGKIESAVFIWTKWNLFKSIKCDKWWNYLLKETVLIKNGLIFCHLYSGSWVTKADKAGRIRMGFHSPSCSSIAGC